MSTNADLPARRRLPAYFAAAVVLLVASGADAQERLISGAVTAGSGISLGSGQDGAITQRSPLFIDLAARTWSDEEPDLVWGGSLRLEVEGRPAVAAVPRAELRRRIGPLILQPGVGVPFFFAPFTMLGAEASLTILLPLGGGVALSGSLLVDAFVLGSEVPEDSALVMFNGAFGVDIQL